MHQLPAYTSWKITCRSAEEAQLLRRWLAPRIDLDRVFTDAVRAAPNGVEQVQTARHRLGDYFADIRTVTDAQGTRETFRLVFHRRPEAGRFSKDLMVNILQEIEAAPQRASVEVETKGEVNPTE
jgi:hypothetical protein